MLTHLTELQDPGEVAVQVDVEAVLGVRRQRDPLDLAAHDLHRLGLDLRVGQSLVERRHLLPVHRGKVRVQPHLGQLGRRCQPLLQRRLLRLQLGHARLHRRLVKPILDRPDHARDLAAHRLEPALILGAALALLGGQAVDLVVEGAGELLDQLGRQQAVLEAVEHPALQFLTPDSVMVAAGPLRAMGGAAVVVRVDDREAAAACAAGEQAAQQIFLPVRAVQRVAVGVPAHDQPDLRLPGLDGVPEHVVDDAQLGHRHTTSHCARGFGRATRLPVRGSFKPRYLVDEARPACYLKTLQPVLTTAEFNQLLFLYTCRANPILADFVREVYWERYAAGAQMLSKEDARAFIRRGVDDGKTIKRWSDSVIVRVSNYLLGTCADYDLLGKLARSGRGILPFRIEPKVAAFLAHDLHFKGVGDSSLLAHEDWQLFGLEREDVRGELKRLALRSQIILQSAGSVTHIGWRHKTMQDFIDVFAQG